MAGTPSGRPPLSNSNSSGLLKALLKAQPTPPQQAPPPTPAPAEDDGQGGELSHEDLFDHGSDSVLDASADILLSGSPPEPRAQHSDRSDGPDWNTPPSSPVVPLPKRGPAIARVASSSSVDIPVTPDDDDDAKRPRAHLVGPCTLMRNPRAVPVGGPLAEEPSSSSGAAPAAPAPAPLARSLLLDSSIDLEAIAAAAAAREAGQQPQQQPYTPPFVVAAAAAAAATDFSSPALVSSSDSIGGDAAPAAGPDASPAAPGSGSGKPRITPQDFDILSLVGQGAFGKVFQVQHRASGRIYAMKVMKKAAVLEKNQAEYMRTERDVLTTVDHPFIVTIRFSFQTAAKLYLVLDFINGGHLFFQLYRAGIFEEALARLYTAEIVLALSHLHKLGIAHRDLKPENVLLDAEGHVKLTDFGLAKVITNGSRHNSLVGTIDYMAPEIVAGRGHGMAADWWSLGILLYEMLTGAPPFRAKNRSLLQKKITSEKIKFPPFLSSQAHKLLTALLQREEARRLGANAGGNGGDAVQAHDFFKGLNWRKLLNKEIPAPFRPQVASDRCTANFDEMWTSMPACDSPTSNPEVEAEKDPFVGYTYCRESALEAVEATVLQHSVSALSMAEAQAAANALEAAGAARGREEVLRAAAGAGRGQEAGTGAGAAAADADPRCGDVGASPRAESGVGSRGGEDAGCSRSDTAPDAAAPPAPGAGVADVQPTAEAAVAFSDAGSGDGICRAARGAIAHGRQQQQEGQTHTFLQQQPLLAAALTD